MKKILHIITGLNDGGAEAVLFRLCSSEKKCQHVVISLTNYGKYGSLLEEIGVPVHCLNMPSSRVNINGLFGLFKLVRNIRPDAVQTWMYHADLIGGVISRIAGVKNIIWGVHHTTLDKRQSKKLTILTAKINALLSFLIPRKIIYCAIASRIAQEAIGFKKSIGVIVPNGYNVNEFSPHTVMRDTFRQELQLSQDTFLIGHVGRYDPLKDHKNLIQSIGLLKTDNKKIKIVMVGAMINEENDELVNYINKKSHRSLFHLLGQRSDIPKIMNGLDLLVLSSSSEAFPNVLNEAMACGTPCVTTNVGDAPIIVGDTGWIVPPKDPQSLVCSIAKAIDEKNNNPNNWTKRKYDCHQRIVNNFSLEKMTSSYYKVWFDE
ncbi:TPA: glycosyltransferase family 4 protein [Providencia alcalifaciens]